MVLIIILWIFSTISFQNRSGFQKILEIKLLDKWYGKFSYEQTGVINFFEIFQHEKTFIQRKKHCNKRLKVCIYIVISPFLYISSYPQIRF